MMLSPNRKPYLTPRTDHGKSVAFAFDPPSLPPPPRTSLAASAEVAGGGEEMDDWRRFKEAGFLDEAEMERKDRLALQHKIQKLENELYDYQYNMGLLLVERKEWTSRHEELSQALAEAEELFKREQSSHLVAVSEAEIREDDLKKALVYEKKCVADLEKRLRALHEEQEHVKIESEKNLAEASNLVIGVKERSLDVNAKLRDADAKLAEVNRKCSELDLKMQELEARENVLQRECLSLKTEQEAHKTTFYKKREDLMGWENSLQEREKKLCEDRSILNEREDKADENDHILMEKERYLEDADKLISSSIMTLKEKETDVKKSLEDIITKEEESGSVATILKLKEEELIEFQKKLQLRGSVELQKLLDEQQASLDENLSQFNAELEERRKLFDKELRTKEEEFQQNNVEINHREQKLMKRESALDTKAEKIMEKEKDMEGILRKLKEIEKSVKTDSKRVEMERRELQVERESLWSLKDELEKIKADVAERKLEIQEEGDSLKIKSHERSEHVRLQTEFKMQLEKCRDQQEMLRKEHEALSEEKVKFEREWQTLDAKRSAVVESQRNLLDEKKNLEKWKLSEEERLKKERGEMEEYARRELESIRLEEESSAAEMKQEERNSLDKLKVEHIQLIQDFEMMKRDFKAPLCKRQEDLEKNLLSREEEFEVERERELKTINELRISAQREKEEVEGEIRRLEKNKQILDMNKRQLEEHRQKMNEDTEQLTVLSLKLKVQREELSRERDRFLSFVEKLRNCKACGEMTREFIFSDLQPPHMGDVLPVEQWALEVSNNLQDRSSLEGAPMETSPDGYAGSDSGVGRSFLQKCASKLFHLSPNKIDIPSALPWNVCKVVAEENLVGSGSAADRKHTLECGTVGDEAEASVQVVKEYHNHKESIASDMVKDLNREPAASFDGVESPEVAQQTERRKGRKRTVKKVPVVHGAQSVATVTTDADALLINSPGKILISENMCSKDIPIDEDSHSDSVYKGKVRGKVRGKRQHAESSQMTDHGPCEIHNEGPSESAVARGHKKKQRTIPLAVQTPGQKRYNLRRPKNLDNKITGEASDDLINPGRKEGVGIVDGITTDDIVNNVPSSNLGKHELVGDLHMSRVEFSRDKIVRFRTVDVAEDTVDATGQAESTELNDYSNATEQFPKEDEDESVVNEDEDYNDDSGEDSVDPGTASIGQKIWTFFTT